MGTIKHLNLFILVSVLSFRHCHGCTPILTNNALTIAGTVIETTLTAAKHLIPVFNSSTVPNIDSFVNEFDAGLSNEDIHLNITQLLTKYGYGAEQHEVQTYDGYILNMFRIPGNGPLAFVMHGILSCADDFVTVGPGRALAYLLADQGYDVWLGNARGNKHSRKHVTMSPNCAEFWDFSWDEIGRYDLPAMIDYILALTGQEKLAYVGHSQGCTTFFVMTSELPEYNDKISVMVALSAVAFVNNSRSPIVNILKQVHEPLFELTKTIGLVEFLSRDPITDLIFSVACGNDVTATVFCQTLVFIAFGFDYAQLNATLLPVVYGHSPAGCATKQFIHYLQLGNSGKFANFDYGTLDNLKKYGSSSPPDYPLDKVTAKIANIYSDGDYFTATLDRERLESQLPNLIESYRVPLDAFNHADFLLANDLKPLVNDKVVQIINNNV